ncbi:16S rRNA (guanine(966)-N(2))-methyltransferase RsmD [Candidatus Kinetoplastidibacterium crithidiae]|uniref:N6-adenine-specific methylase n=1 Tax=Candidatus Kinetoplastidibacterium crithidiae TCC036E TaxID=1208918 RepID=M1M5Y7_9PROT|nr:16S rRNA (guanine(966)-N(2))-methyltransferase RsmD [Candidatus Kinetoplastibacterium crithidii]AFZ82787.1 N6-adenine-specific methyltransferase [Candidatus Kinetoplastibacterium crithidii (ex Angomonas deanei ATCC 30255)]AGF47560.1 N6-adenine-specific methylase [Candidatus Kinetoplastibacterium crithidii TCC036E]
MTNNSVYIISGIYRNTKITFPKINGLRPTPNRVKETLFNWINNKWNNNFTDKNILDLFAGSGSLGFEAASRGANFVQMVEYNKQAIKSIQLTCKKLSLNQVNIFPGKAIDFLQQKQTKQFDLILLDPPFQNNEFEKIWNYLPRVLNSNSIVYIESNLIVQIPDYLNLIRTKKAGKVYFNLYEYNI